MAAHALGQISYPGPRRMRRQAVLSVRHVSDFLPRRLALTTAAIFVSAVAAIGHATLPGFAAGGGPLGSRPPSWAAGTARKPGWPRPPVSPAMLTTASLALLVFVAVLSVTAVGQARLAEAPGWVPAGLLTAGACAAALPAILTARFRQGVRDAPRGLDAALRAITIHRVARTLAATLTAQAAVLLLTQSNAWAAVLGRDAFWETDPAATSWGPALAAGTVLGVAATVIAVIPVGAAAPRSPAPLPGQEAAA
ncbi:hypothetical protein [Arthrobacter sp. NicSoilB8]|uniref:hypothetical protein n=1 Tax=Arthrobacter sp. NicSoilB8 TaxID=2830998 RepID=UPI001CC3DD0C|nr:hypothetical protein [Arthrobacter sp. NicSoilB8]BCW72376.1 hypothetical protein NicSoilB8_34200 [Arthrobacter sp. NicSoilB8]